MKEYVKKQSTQGIQQNSAPVPAKETNGIPNSTIADVFAGKKHATSEMMGHSQNLAPSIAAKMSRAFGMNVMGMQIYRSDAMAGSDMKGMAQGNKVVLSSDVDLNTTAGQAILGHELSHIHAQSQGIGMGDSGLYENAALEQQADTEGLLAAQGRSIYSDGAMDMGVGMSYGFGMEGVEGVTSIGSGMSASAGAPMQAKKSDDSNATDKKEDLFETDMKYEASKDKDLQKEYAISSLEGSDSVKSGEEKTEYAKGPDGRVSAIKEEDKEAFFKLYAGYLSGIPKARKTLKEKYGSFVSDNNYDQFFEEQKNILDPNGTEMEKHTVKVNVQHDTKSAPSSPPKQEPPKQEPPKQEPPKQEPPKQEPPKQEIIEIQNENKINEESSDQYNEDDYKEIYIGNSPEVEIQNQGDFNPDEFNPEEFNKEEFNSEELDLGNFDEEQEKPNLDFLNEKYKNMEKYRKEGIFDLGLDLEFGESTAKHVANEKKKEKSGIGFESYKESIKDFQPKTRFNEYYADEKEMAEYKKMCENFERMYKPSIRDPKKQYEYDRHKHFLITWANEHGIPEEERKFNDDDL